MTHYNQLPTSWQSFPSKYTNNFRAVLTLKTRSDDSLVD